MTRVGEGGALAIVLHTHMPFVHGYGTWPFGEEWLWEVYASSYLPIARLAGRAPLTVSLTPVVADQLEAPGAAERCLAFIDGVRRGSHAEDRDGLERGGLIGEIAASDHSWALHEAWISEIGGLRDDLLAPLAAVATWTSSASHAVLPLLATEAGVRLQAGSGIASHLRRTGRWDGGFWLPECAWDPELEAPLIDEGVRTVCVEVEPTEDSGAVQAPWRTPGGLRVIPIDRTLIDLVWHHTGYPGHASYRDSHRRSFQNTPLWANSGAPYDPAEGEARARADARAWAHACAERLAGGKAAFVAFDTELFGHWWHEGPAFLEAAVDELAAAGVELVQADELLARLDATVADPPPPSTWGAGRDLRTWTGPAVSTIAWELRRAELGLLAGRLPGEPSDAALRDLLALQSSDWAFMVTEQRAASYGWARFAGHRQAVSRSPGALPSSAPPLRHLAPDLARDALAVG